MAADYRNYKTPYYEITVSDPSYSRHARLPAHIMKLVQSVEIQESYVSGTLEAGGSTCKISMIEGSREPASPNPLLGTNGLYKLRNEDNEVDTDISGSITNRVGSVVDLRFSGSTGITFTTAEEKASNTIDNSVQTNVIGEETTRKYKREAKSPRYLFDHMNKLTITWGYRENWNTTKRTMVFSIMQVETIFADSGPTIINIMGTDLHLPASQITGTEGKAFGEVTYVKGGELINFNDLKTDEMLRKICDTTGWNFIISKGLPSDSLDKNKQKIWISGQSFGEFLTKLAKMNNCYYKLVNNPKTGKATLIFVKKTDFEAKSPIKDKTLLLYKNPGSLIRSVTVNIDFSTLVSTAVGAIDSEGKLSQKTTDVSQDMFYKSEFQVDADPTKDPAIKSLADNVLGGKYTSKKEITPNENQGFQKDLTQTKLADNSRLVQITVDMIGYPKMTPGVVDIGGIGVRYSGKYRVLTVEHRLDESGYDTKFTGTTFALPEGDLLSDSAPIGTEEQNVDVDLFQPRQQNPTVRDAIDDFLGI